MVSGMVQKGGLHPISTESRANILCYSKLNSNCSYIVVYTWSKLIAFPYRSKKVYDYLARNSDNIGLTPIAGSHVSRVYRRMKENLIPITPISQRLIVSGTRSSPRYESKGHAVGRLLSMDLSYQDVIAARCWCRRGRLLATHGRRRLS